ncbi:MAG: hypothetical protein H7A23_06815 [Leptospiraceae bacterium]|nr:hypothetical protein [Leptospiraceae bacterium]MCP5494252.1 hypothetical protein [Leptospiraceae bacterium]
MSKKENPENEYTPYCTFYSKYLHECPASKSILDESGLKRLMTNCLTKKYVSCEIYTALQERAA